MDSVFQFWVLSRVLASRKVPACVIRAVFTTWVPPFRGTIKHILHADAHVTNSVEWSPNGKYLACDTAHSVYIWNMLELCRNAGSKPVCAHSSWDGVYAIAWSPSSEYLVIAGAGMQIADVEGNILHEIDRQQCTTARVAWSPCGRRIVTCDYDAICVWTVQDEAGGLCAPTLHCKFQQLGVGMSMDLSPDGRYLAICASDLVVVDMHAALLDDAIRSTDLVLENCDTSAYNTARWSPSGQYLAGLGEEWVQIWNRDGSQRLCFMGPQIPHSSFSIAWDPSSRYLVLGHDTKSDASKFVILDIDREMLMGKESLKPMCNRNDVAWSPCGRYIATCRTALTVWH